MTDGSQQPRIREMPASDAWYLIACTFWLGAIAYWAVAAWGWLRYGNWTFPGWTLGPTIGFEPNWASDYVGLQIALAWLSDVSVGWALVVAAVFSTMAIGLSDDHA